MQGGIASPFGMDVQALLPDPERLNLHAVHLGSKVIWLDISSQASSSSTGIIYVIQE